MKLLIVLGHAVRLHRNDHSKLLDLSQEPAGVDCGGSRGEPWWHEQRRYFRIYTSVFTLAEAGLGDPSLAAKRLATLEGIPTLDIPEDFGVLESELIQLFQLPAKAATDASHLGLAIIHKMDYLLTWNCTHLANAVLQKELMDYCGYHHLHVPVICTPETLIKLHL